MVILFLKAPQKAFMSRFHLFYIILITSFSLNPLFAQSISKAWSPSFYNYLKVIKPAKDGGWFVGGQSGRKSLFGYPKYYGYLAKLDRFGNELWKYSFPSEIAMLIDVIEQSQDLIIANFVFGECDTGTGSSFFCALDHDGNKLWEKSNFDDPGIPVCTYGAKFYQLPDSSIEILGGIDYVIAKFNNNGIQVLSKCEVKNNGVFDFIFTKAPNGNKLGLSYYSNEVIQLKPDCSKIKLLQMEAGEGSIVSDIYFIACQII